MSLTPTSEAFNGDTAPVYAAKSAAEARPRVRFGPGPAQDVPAEWAEHMLSKLAADDPRRFGMLLAAAALDMGTAPNG